MQNGRSGPHNLWYGYLHRSCFVPMHAWVCMLSSNAIPADGSDAEIVHGYTSALCIEAAQRPDLEKSELNPALVGVLLKAIEGI